MTISFKLFTGLDTTQTVTLATAYTESRFQFAKQTSDFVQTLVIRFLSGYGQNVGDSDPEQITIHDIRLSYKNGKFALRVIYELEDITYETTAKFKYHVNPTADFFTQIQGLHTEIVDNLTLGYSK